MSKYFAVRHKKTGFVISYFIPISFVIVLWDSKRIRKGILIYAGIEITLILTKMVGETTGVILYWFALIGFLFVWWKYYSECVKVLESKNNSIAN